MENPFTIGEHRLRAAVLLSTDVALHALERGIRFFLQLLFIGLHIRKRGNALGTIHHDGQPPAGPLGKRCSPCRRGTGQGRPA